MTIRCVAFVSALALAACSGGGDDGGSAASGPPPASKQDAAQQVAQVSAAVQQITVTAESSGTKKQSVDVHPLTTVTASFNGTCAGGGTVDVQTTLDATASGTPGNGQGSADVTRVATFHACKGPTGYTVDGGPLTLHVKAETSTSNTGGTVKSSTKSTVEHNGGLTVTGPFSGSFSFESLSVVSSVDVSSGGGAASAQVSVVINGGVTINGGKFTYANETFSVSASR